MRLFKPPRGVYKEEIHPYYGSGNTGIGGEAAGYFAAAGADAFIEDKYPGVWVSTISAHVTKQSEVERAFSQFAQAGKIDVLIHSAALIGLKEKLTELDSTAYLGAIQTNLTSAFWVSRSFVQYTALTSYFVAKMTVYYLWDAVAIANSNLNIFHTQPSVVLEVPRVLVTSKPTMYLVVSFNLWLASPKAQFLKDNFLWCNWDIDELKARATELKAGPEFSIGLMGWPWTPRR
ncbi:hypothetical protein GQX73_g1259 [Xylaria multiplex]|uniref:Uncharacterized protein n=1 Tax=Xylaria multiplex TaxID=323545 RepID=A0A7C8IW60_9PEZI|nr:hypothetical protein GQX73_g1259 [Xylaria multiplex]